MHKLVISTKNILKGVLMNQNLTVSKDVNKEFRCLCCGGVIDYDVKLSTTCCPICGNNTFSN